MKITHIDVRTRATKLVDIYNDIRGMYPDAKITLCGASRYRSVLVYSVDAREQAQVAAAEVHEILHKHEPKEVQECFEFFS